MEHTGVTEETMKKSAFTAKTEYEYQQLMYPESYLIDMVLEEQKEELTFTYEMKGKKAAFSLKEEDILTVLAVLMNVLSLEKGLKKYSFSLNPQNLFYDINNQVFAKTRDIYMPGTSYDKTEFLLDYQALVGFALQKKYSFEDFRKGGKKLLSKNPLLSRVSKASDPEEIVNVLYEEYEKIKQERKEKKMLLDRGRYKGMKVSIFILAAVCIAATAYLGYYFFKEKPYTNAVIEVNNAYIESDYVACIDAMKEIPVSDIELHQKYILANSYVRGENLSQEQKTNIMEGISMSAAPVRLDYWIYLGRGETEQAIDIAMQQSDDQLLLYAYMKKKSVIESDGNLSGDEKTQQLEDISSKMKPLMEQYETEEKQ